MTGRYLLSALRRRPAETLAAAIAVAVTTAFLAALGSFAAQTGSRLSIQASQRVAVDWQVQVAPGADLQAAAAALRRVPGFAGARQVDYAKVTGLQATSPDGTRTTGTAYLVSLPADYPVFAPSQLRHLLGAGTGVLLQQQTAANLAAGVGDTVQVLGSSHGTRVDGVRVDGVVDLPNADSFFQVIGAPAGSTPAAAPDNVLFVPPSRFAALTAGPGVSVLHQFHVRLDHAGLPPDPAAAADDISQRANHYVTDVAGSALVGDDLGGALSAAREDAIYARLLVLLLGVPGLVLSGVVTALVISLRNDRQCRDLGLLRLRGATPARAAGLLGLVALADGLLGAGLGVLGALGADRLALGPDARLSPGWLGAALLTGVLLAVLTELAPAARLLLGGSPSVNAQPVVRTGNPLALRLGLDFILLGVSALAFWLTSRSDYHVVVVPEGVPVASVNYGALLAPALAWPGMALLIWRLTTLALSRPRRLPRQDPTGALPDLRREVIRRRARPVARGATGLAVAVAVALSTAVFTATYDRQARLDVALSVGSDVAVTLPPDAGTSLDPAIVHGPGVQAVEMVSHRLAYVGPDLQDLYGIDARTVGRAAPLQNAFTTGAPISAVLDRLAGTPDGALVSQETLHDYQLRIGDALRLRLKNRAGVYVTVPFRISGVISEFATAPRDSFIVANRAYLARTTHAAAVQTLLVRTDNPGQVAAQIRAPAGALVNDISAPRIAVPSASGLAAGSLAGLARLTLAFGLLLAAASAVLVLVLGAVQRRRSMVALAVIGANPRQRAGFLWTEARWILTAGLAGGLAIGALIAAELVTLLKWIFDPPPEHPAVPVFYLTTLLVSVLATALTGTALSARWSRRVDPSLLRDS